MKARYVRAMGVLHRICMWVSAICLIVITLVIPWGVLTRYAFGYGSKWPEPMAILLMIVFSFFSAAACYRDNLHIAVLALPNSLPEGPRRMIGWVAEIFMIVANLFMLVWGIELVNTTWHQVIAEFPIVSVGLTYLPVPVGGTITVLFVIERLWTGALFAAPEGRSVAAVASE